MSRLGCWIGSGIRNRISIVGWLQRRIRCYSRMPWIQFAALILLITLFVKGIAWIIPLPERKLFPPSATLVFDRKGSILRAFTSQDEMWRIRTPLEKVSPVLRKFLLSYEDRWFYNHPGVNPFAMTRAMGQNLQGGRVVSGGSTLTMQIARIIEPKPRNWLSKIIEASRAVQLEQRYSKDQLLEIYFNIAPYGGNIEGVAAASWLYFGKEPSRLSYGEAALLAALPNAPSELRPDRYPEKAKHARDHVLAIAYHQGIISYQDYQAALLEEVPRQLQDLPFIAPQFCQTLHSNFPDEPRIYSTIDRHTQLFCEDLLRAHVQQLRPDGISNGAVMIIDNYNHEVLAAVGSSDFFDKTAQGQVNGVLAPRSPGSALKPFVYALGFDNGVITPRHYLEDVPIDFEGGYSPENYDRKFNGIVSAREALGRSLNVPVINLEVMLGENNGLYDLLHKVHCSTVAPDDKYGLSIGLGSCEVTLYELTSLYSALASEGIYQLPRTRLNQAENIKIRLMSAGTAYIVTDILSEVRRPDLPTCWEFTSLPRIAWKTGTSYDHRDAWSIGYNPRYTVGVWLGNFSGEGRTRLVGAEVASPLLFDIFTHLSGDSQKWFDKPASVEIRKVCAISGQLPGKYCDTLVDDLCLTDRPPTQECQFHQAYLIDSQTGYRLPPNFYSARKTQEKVYIKWPPRIAAWMEAEGYHVDPIPPLLPDWQQLQPGQAPVIRSPSSDYIYQLREGIELRFQKICLEAAAANDVQKLYWFIDGQLFGTVKPGAKLFYLPQPGNHRLVCQDDQGRSTEVKLTIKE